MTEAQGAELAMTMMSFALVWGTKRTSRHGS